MLKKIADPLPLDWIQNGEVDDPVKKPVDADHTVSVHLSHLFETQEYKGHKTDDYGETRDHEIEYGIRPGFQRITFSYKAKKRILYYR